MNNKSIKIAFLGIDERTRSAYQLFFENIKSVKYELVEDYRNAQLCLIDKDSYNIKQQYNELIENHSEKYVLVFSIVEHACVNEKEFFLQKPIKRDVLQRMLNKIYGYISGKRISKTSAPTNSQIKNTVEKISRKYIRKPENVAYKEAEKPVKEVEDNTVVSINKVPRVSTSNAGKLLKIEHEEYYVGDHPDVDINDHEQLKQAIYSPDVLLQSVMEQACKQSQYSGHIVQLNVFNYVFYFDAKGQKVHSNVGPAVIRPLCVVPHDNQAAYIVKPSSFRDDLNYIIQSNKNNKTGDSPGKYSWSMEAFMWVVTLWCSRGRVPEGVDLTQPVYLMRWPNLTRLEQLPHALRIAALIYDQPRTLVEAARQLGIEQRYVFAFFSACKAIGLSGVSCREVDKTFISEKPEQHKNKSIMSKLLGKLVNFSNDACIDEVASNADK